MTLGERIKRFRELRGLSQNALAKRAKVSRPIISTLESGKSQTTSLEIAKRLANALGVSLDFLAETPEQETVEETPLGDYFARLFNEHAQCIERTRKISPGNPDSCYICGRTSGEVRTHYRGRIEEKYKNDPRGANDLLQSLDENYGLGLLIYRTKCPICLICFGSIRGESGLTDPLIIDEIVAEVRTKGDKLVPDPYREIPGLITPDD